DHVLQIGGEVGQGEPDELLGDGGRTLRHLVGGDVGDERPHDPPGVHTVVLVEVVVLGGDDGVDYRVAHLFQGDVATVLVVHRGDQGLAVGGVDVADLRSFSDGQLGRKLVEVLQTLLGQQARHRHRGEEGSGHHHPGEQAAEGERSDVDNDVVFPGADPAHMISLRDPGHTSLFRVPPDADDQDV